MNVECPECDKEDFANEKGMKIHHKRMHDESLSGVRVNCAACGNSKRVKPNHNEKYEKHFCNRECQGEWRSGRELDENHKEAIRQSMLGREITWNDKVSEALTGRSIPSEQNGMYGVTGEDHPAYGKERSDEVKKAISRANSGSNNYWWKGGTSGVPFGWNWRTQRKKALERDNHNCQICGLTNKLNVEITGKGLAVHHIISRNFIFHHPFKTIVNHANDIDNLISLCHDCHMEVEKEGREVPSEHTMEVANYTHKEAFGELE